MKCILSATSTTNCGHLLVVLLNNELETKLNLGKDAEWFCLKNGGMYIPTWKSLQVGMLQVVLAEWLQLFLCIVEKYYKKFDIVANLQYY